MYRKLKWVRLPDLLWLVAEFPETSESAREALVVLTAALPLMRTEETKNVPAMSENPALDILIWHPIESGWGNICQAIIIDTGNPATIVGPTYDFSEKLEVCLFKTIDQGEKMDISLDKMNNSGELARDCRVMGRRLSKSEEEQTGR